jgi:hypothetical protein
MLALLVPAPVQAEQAHVGRAAQLLHCAALMMLVAGLINNETGAKAFRAGRLNLRRLPGPMGERASAVTSRYERLKRGLPLPRLMEEFDRIFPDCP